MYPEYAPLPWQNLPDGLGGLRATRPPYHSQIQIGELAETWPRGTVVLVELTLESLIAQPAPVSRAVQELRRRMLDCPFVGQLATAADPRQITVLRRLGFAGLRAFVPVDWDAHRLRAAVGRVGINPNDVTLWLQLRLERARPRSIARSLARILCGESVGPAEVGACRRFLPDGLPSLHRWRMAGKVLPALMRLQTEPQLTVEEANRETPYSTPAAFSRACKALFNSRPTQVRDVLGWEWLVTWLLGS